MRFARATGSNYPGILALQEANLFDNLSAEARADGYLSARFSQAQFEHMNADVAVVAATHGDRVAGYLCASSVDFNRQFPLLAAMIGCYDDVIFRGRSLAKQSTFVYGPVCIARTDRGGGVLRGMFDELLREVAGRFDAGACFVAAGNARSLAAHRQGLGMQRVAEFEFQQRGYHILAFDVPTSHA
ncbi:MAG TPA: hypothetical protein VEV20_07165 [Burkholderiales bacterium]|jgi:hypothetical protein|nr:hypothetical protein [Burkholderiales bacterium]